MRGQDMQNPQPAAKAPAVADEVIARVSGEAITEKQILGTINQLATRAQQQKQITAQQLQQKDVIFFNDALDTLVGSILLRNEGREKNIVVDKAGAEKNLQSLRGQFPNEEEFQKALKGQGLTEAEVRKAIEDNLLIQQVLDPIFKTLPPITDADVQKFYDDNPKFFEGPAQAHAAHVFLKVDQAATAEQRAAMRSKLEAIRNDIETKKITFAEAAAKYSDDKQNSQNAGDLGTFKRGELVPQLEAAIFSSKPGTLTQIVETEFGYHLISVIDLKPATTTPLTQVKANIQQYLDQKARQDATTRHIAELKAKAKIEIVMPEEEWRKRHTTK
jgi:peptidyl-prolyl cis-trans isomerase C